MGMAQSTSPEPESMSMKLSKYTFVEAALRLRGLSIETITEVTDLEDGIRFIRTSNTRLRRFRVSDVLFRRKIPRLLIVLVDALCPRFLLPKLDSIETWQQWKEEDV